MTDIVFEDAELDCTEYDGDPIIVTCSRCGCAIGYGGGEIVKLEFGRTGYRCSECDQVWQIILWDVTEEANGDA